MTDWKQAAIEALDAIRAEIETSEKPTFFVGMFIGEEDLIRDRPMIFYSNTSHKHLSPVVAYAAYRLAMKSAEASHV